MCALGWDLGRQGLPKDDEVETRPRAWAAIRPDSSPREKRRSGRRHTEEDDRAGPQRAAAVRKPRRAALEETSPAGSVTLDL